MKQIAVIDFETRSGIPLSRGIYNYSHDPKADILCLGWRLPTMAKAEVWEPGMEFPPALRAWLAAGKPMIAHNAHFDRHMWQIVAVKKHNFPPVPLHQWRDSMAWAYYAGMPGALAKLAPALRTELRKDAGGKQLIRTFCIPNSTGGFNTKDTVRPKSKVNYAKAWADMLAYCALDTDVLFDIVQMLDPLPDMEQKLWETDARINTRGVTVDLAFTQACSRLAAEQIESYRSACVAEHGISPTQVGAMLQKLAEYGTVIGSLNKEAVAAALEDPEITPEAKSLLVYRQLASKTSAAKYKKLEQLTCSDGRVRNLLQYSGASRTHRWAGRGIQPQNLPTLQSDVLDAGYAADAIAEGATLETVELLFGDPLDIISRCVRSALVASPGHTFSIYDWSAIEVRVLFWLADDATGLNIYRGAGKIYEEMAAYIYQVKPEEITKSDPRRKMGKATVLGCGYGMGYRKFAETNGLEEDLANVAVKAYREKFPGVPALWRELDEAFRDVVSGARARVHVRGKLTVYRGAVGNLPAVHIALPSGNVLTYAEPALQDVKLSKVDAFGACKFQGRWAKVVRQNLAGGQHEIQLEDDGSHVRVSAKALEYYKRDVLTYWGPKSGPKTEEEQDDEDYNSDYRLIATYGAKLVENVTQAVARDICAATITRMEAAGLKTVLHVHDEIINEVPLAEAEALHKKAHALMVTLPDWAAGLPLAAEGELSTRYKK